MRKTDRILFVLKARFAASILFFFLLRARAVRSLAYQLYFSTVCQCRSQQDTCWAFVYLAALHSLFALNIYIKRACLSGESGTLRSAIWVCLSTDILAPDLFNHWFQRDVKHETEWFQWLMSWKCFNQGVFFLFFFLSWALQPSGAYITFLSIMELLTQLDLSLSVFFFFGHISLLASFVSSLRKTFGFHARTVIVLQLAQIIFFLHVGGRYYLCYACPRNLHWMFDLVAEVRHCIGNFCLT